MNKQVIFGIGAVVLAIPALALAYWLISPYFIDDEVDEDFIYSVQAEIPDDMTQADAEATMVSAAEGDDKEMNDDMPAEENVAVQLSMGTFIEIDAVHKGEGSATIFELPDGTNLLRFENFRVTNGPDLHVYLSTSDSVTDAIDLGQLKGNVGNQNYEIPADFDVSSAQTVIIYCVPFSVVFSTAALAP